MPKPPTKPGELRAWVIAQVEAVYRDLAARPVERACELRAGCCHFRQTGEVPSVTSAEALLLARAVRAGGRTSVPPHPDGACPLFDDKTGGCRHYAARPFGCRTHFCRAAGGPLARREVVDLIRRLEEASEAWGEHHPRPLPEALGRVLQRW